jgi:MoxR-like ATPase
MKFPYFTGKRKQPEKEASTQLPPPRLDSQNKPENYQASKRLVDAVNVALLLGQPLLLTGEPGTGKTQLAYRVAWELGFDPPLKFETKSTSVARDLFYYYDYLSRFHALQSNTCADVLEYITYNALGTALLLGNKKADIKDFIPEHYQHTGPKRSIVLIDEIDKAPRDFPNDILNEIENMYVKIPELQNKTLTVPKHNSPVVIITSNSEKHLPDAFMRRCVYYHIPFPDKDRLKEIAQLRLKEMPMLTGTPKNRSDHFLTDAIELLFYLRDHAGLKKKPATGELLVWLQSLMEISGADHPILDDLESLLSSLSALIKTKDDLKTAEGAVKQWQPSRLA